MKRIAFGAVALAVVLALVGYAAADAVDKVPGVLTIAAEPPPMSSPLPSAPPEPSVSPPPAPTTAGLTTALAGPLSDPALGSSVAISVVDATTGEQLLAQGVETPRVVASLQKLVSAMVVSQVVPLDMRLTTSVLEAADGHLVLHAGGDLYVNPAAGDPTAIAGRAGLADLADQTAQALAGRPGPWVLSLDTEFARGPEVLQTWDPIDVSYGYTGRVSNLGLSSDRADEGKPSPANPQRRAAAALVDLLTQRGLEVSLASGDALQATLETKGTLAEVHSAPVGDLLGLALRDSDNALMEELARVAHALDPGADGETVGQFITRVAVAQGLDQADLNIVDASGLSSGQTVTVRALTTTLTKATDGAHEAWRSVLLELPIAGLSGTLAERFDTADTRAWAGIPREKTGTLTGTSSVGGWTVDADGRTLFYVVVADKVSPSFVSGTVPARAALDRLVGALTDCGCR